MLPAWLFVGPLLGSEVTVPVTGSAVLGLVLIALVISGTDAVVRAHPRSQTGDLGYRWAFWGLPSALIVVALLPVAARPLGALLVNRAGADGHRPWPRHGRHLLLSRPLCHRLPACPPGLNALIYAVALIIFLVVYQTRVRSILSATEVMVLSGLLSLELLRGSERPLRLVALFAGIVGLVLGEATWALNYWRLNSLTGGLLLLLLFYDGVGLAQHGIQGRISRRVIFEYMLISIATLALIWQFASVDCSASNLDHGGTRPAGYRSLLAQIRLTHTFVGEQGLGRTAEHDVSGLQYVAFVGQAERGPRILLDQQDSDAGAVDLADGLENGSHQERRQTKRWLVQKQNFGVGHQGPADGQHLLLATRQGAAKLTAPLVEARQ